jgi:hypothetical protein
MAYLDNKTITVQAILTNKGRQLLAQNGTLNITSFALADDEINYNLYQPNHPLGSAYYDLAIRNTPILEPFSDETQALKHKLVTLPAGVTSVPIVTVAQSSIEMNKNYSAQQIIAPSTNPTYDTTLGYTAIIVNKNVGTLTVTQTNSLNSTSATIPSFYGSAITEASQVVIGMQFQFIPNSNLTTTTATNIIIIGNESGGSVTIPVTVTVPSTTAS